VGITSMSQLEAILSDVTMFADKVSYATGVSSKFEEARRVFREMMRTLKSKTPPTKLQVATFSKACDTFTTDLGYVPGMLDKLYDMQDYFTFNPPT
jgi:hypothetical protein